jgi:hypothetical protein
VPCIDWLRPHEGRAKHTGENIVRAALRVVLGTRSLKGILIDSVSVGGDADTVAAIAMAPASVSNAFARDIPTVLAETLENGTCGRDHLVDVDRQLAGKFGLPIVAAGPSA